MTSRAVILAGGHGTRMRPLTERRPKHLLPLGDSPVIGHQLRMLARAGITDVVLATAYHAEAFRPVLGDGADFGVELRYAREETPLGTGGALRHALVSAGWVAGRDTEPVVVLNGDLLTEHDLTRHVEAHARGGQALTVHVRHVDDARPYGLIEMDGSRVVAFREKPSQPVGGLVNAGTYVVNPSVVASVPAGVVCSLEREVFPVLAERGDVGVHEEEAYFADVGSPAALLAANLRWARARGEDSVVLTADVASSCAVSESLIMTGARVEPGARLERCVLGPGAVVGRGSHLTNCVLGDDASVGAGVRLSGTVLDVGEHR